MKTPKERARAAAKHIGTTMHKLCENSKINYRSCFNALEKQSMTWPHWSKLADSLNVPVGWLRFGGAIPWENKGGRRRSSTADRDKENESAKEAEALDFAEVMQNQIEVLETNYRDLAVRYLDVLDILDQKNIPFPKRAVKEAKDILDRIEKAGEDQ